MTWPETYPTDDPPEDTTGCPATMEAVRELEVAGDSGCILCGEPSWCHRTENAESTTAKEDEHGP